MLNRQRTVVSEKIKKIDATKCWAYKNVVYTNSCANKMTRPQTVMPIKSRAYKILCIQTVVPTKCCAYEQLCQQKIEPTKCCGYKEWCLQKSPHNTTRTASHRTGPRPVKNIYAFNITFLLYDPSGITKGGVNSTLANSLILVHCMIESDMVIHST